MIKDNQPTTIGGGEPLNIGDAAGLKPLENYLIDMQTDIAKPDYRLNIGGVDMLAAGTIAIVTGEPKQGKSQFLTALVSVIVSGRNFGMMAQGKTPAHGVVWIDTEQSRYEIQTNMRRLLHRCNLDEHTALSKLDMAVYGMRSITGADDMQQKVSEAIALHEPEILVIDNIVHLLSGGINEDKVSEDMVKQFKQMVDERPYMTIVGVLHANYNSEKMRGFLGSVIHQALSDKFTCKKDNGVFQVTHEGRGKELQQPFTFCIDDDGHLAIAGADVAAGVVNPDEALRVAVGDGCNWTELLEKYRKIAKVSEKAAKKILKDKYSRGELHTIDGTMPKVYVLNPDVYPPIKVD